ncbi:putative integral membrane protein [Streptomyces albus]|uniref:Putative integral membrane protein n=1 Tax=Streptomyces albus (strain ATCC 21838 / DSM 41398 / FERM P-419 / JCM 4703 / NBRC 107858) TaxID=1081613 RepID=A0A0B5ELG5_STRA4|nr:putative integral membrane protein [Streptomyces albus]AOU77562.1 putative integral membrane protein [Streptomyces albus]AYN33331.1 MFS transporter [Streptomyces albus]
MSSPSSGPALPGRAPRPTYRQVLRVPHAARAMAAALLGRLSYGTVPLSLLLAVRDASGSYAVAGTAMALFGLAGVALSPARAAVIDRRGPARPLTALALCYALLLGLLTAAAVSGGVPDAALVALAAAAGASTPPLGPVMRALWSRLAPDPELLQRAYSLDSVAEELLYVLGPLLVGLLVAFASPAAGIALSAVLVLAGTLALTSSRAVRTSDGSPADGSPAGGGAVGGGAADGSAVEGGAVEGGAVEGGAVEGGAVEGGAVEGGAVEGGSAGAASEKATPVAAAPRVAAPGGRSAVARLLGGPQRWRSAPLAPVVLLTGALGVGLGALDLLVVAFAEDAGAPGAVAWVLAALSAGSAVGGLVYGAVRWRSPLRTRLALAALGLGLVLAPAGLAPGPFALALVAALAGVSVAPALTTAYLLADATAPPERRTRAGAWVNTAFNAGAASGTAAAGLLLGSLPVAACFALAALPLLLAGLAALTPRGAVRTAGATAPAPARQEPQKAREPQQAREVQEAQKAPEEARKARTAS